MVPLAYRNMHSYSCACAQFLLLFSGAYLQASKLRKGKGKGKRKGGPNAKATNGNAASRRSKRTRKPVHYSADPDPEEAPEHSPEPDQATGDGLASGQAAAAVATDTAESTEAADRDAATADPAAPTDPKPPVGLLNGGCDGLGSDDIDALSSELGLQPKQKEQLEELDFDDWADVQTQLELTDVQLGELVKWVQGWDACPESERNAASKKATGPPTAKLPAVPEASNHNQVRLPAGGCLRTTMGACMYICCAYCRCRWVQTRWWRVAASGKRHKCRWSSAQSADAS